MRLRKWKCIKCDLVFFTEDLKHVASHMSCPDCERKRYVEEMGKVMDKPVLIIPKLSPFEVEDMLAQAHQKPPYADLDD